MLDRRVSGSQSIPMRFTKWDYIIVFVVVRMDLEKDGPAGIHPTALAEQFKARSQMSRAEKAGLFEEQRLRLQPQFAALVVGTGLVILGFGFHFFL